MQKEKEKSAFSCVTTVLWVREPRACLIMIDAGFIVQQQSMTSLWVKDAADNLK